MTEEIPESDIFVISDSPPNRRHDPSDVSPQFPHTPAHHDPPEPVVYQPLPIGPRPTRRRGSGSTTPSTTYRTLYWIIRIGIPLGYLALTAIAIMVFPLFFCLLIWLFPLTFFPQPARFLASHICAGIITSIRCRCCGFEFDAVSRWTVGGYTDYRERNAYLVKSQIDGAYSGHIDCPQCSATVMLR